MFSEVCSVPLVAVTRNRYDVLLARGFQCIRYDASELKQSQVVRVSGLQRTHQQFKFGEATQIPQARVFHEKRPARETGADAAFEPCKRFRRPFQQGENAGDLIISMVRVAK